MTEQAKKKGRLRSKKTPNPVPLLGFQVIDLLLEIGLVRLHFDRREQERGSPGKTRPTGFVWSRKMSNYAKVLVSGKK